MSSTATTKSMPREELSPTIRWRLWALLDMLPYSLLVVLGIFGLGAAAAYAASSNAMGILAATLLAFSLCSFLLPVTYEIQPQGIIFTLCGIRRLLPWKRLRRYRLRPTGVVLYSRSVPSPLDVFGGQFLPFGQLEKEIIAALRNYMPPESEQLD